VTPFLIDSILPSDPTAVAKSLAAKLGGTAFPLDAENGIVRVAFPNVHIDLAKRQGLSWDQDLDRRDFTINALAVPLHQWLKPNWKDSLVDRHNGLKDLKKKTLRAVSKNIFADDPLRLLRAYRLAAQLGLSVEKGTRGLIQKNRKRLARVAPERIREEMLKIFSTDAATAALKDMEKDRLLEIIFPEAAKLRRCAPGYYGKGGVLKHSLDSVGCYEDILKTLSSWFPRAHTKIRAYLNEPLSGYSRSAHLKWALLLHDLGKPATAKMMGGRMRFFEHEHVGASSVLAMAPRYRWSNLEAARYERLVRNHMRVGNLASHEVITDRAIHRFFRDLQEDGIAMLLVSLGDHLTYLTPKQRGKKRSDHEKTTVLMVNRYYNAREKIVPPKLITGHDVMTAFKLPPSPYIGELLEAVTDAQSDGTVKTKEDAMAFLSTYVKKQK
jgi:tRNA nucleotidyltransferase/poly(A) polymerase